jgi:hypothetical protein
MMAKTILEMEIADKSCGRNAWKENIVHFWGGGVSALAFQ